jgi:hypothetical protein
MDNDSKYNGRLFIPENANYDQFDLFTGSNDTQPCFQDSISTMQELNPLSLKYFGKNNINKIQNLIILEVKTRDYTIGRQSEIQLQIIMRSIYLSNSKNLMTNIDYQINELNKMVVDESVKVIISNIKQYLGYRKDISNPMPTRTNPTNVSSKGESLSHPYLP